MDTIGLTTRVSQPEGLIEDGGMKSRRKAREAALQALYQCDTLGEWNEDAIQRFVVAFYPDEPPADTSSVQSDNWQTGAAQAGSVLSGNVQIDGAQTDRASTPEQKSRSGELENREFAFTLIRGVMQYLDEIDRLVAGASTHWSIARMARVDRNLLRLAAYELQFLPDVPPNVVINEAIEIAKAYGSDESPMFINGVLDHIAKSVAEQRGLLKKSANSE